MKKTEPSPTNFSGNLEDSVQKRVDSCNLIISNPQRLQAISETGLLKVTSELALDRLAKLAAKILKAPLTLVSLVTDEKQLFKGAYGLQAEMDLLREIPIDGSICRYTLKGEEIIADDAANDPLLKYHPATGPWGIGAFMAIPMINPEGMVLGAFCAVHPEPHVWTSEEIFVMEELTASIMTEIYLRQQINELHIEKELRERFILTLTHDLRTPLTSSKLNAQMISSGKQDAARVQKSALKISANIDRADRLIQDILDSNKIKSGHELTFHKSSFDLSQLTRIIISDFQSQFGERFELNVPSSLKAFLDYDGTRRMLENLLHNAVKYGSEDSIIKLNVIKHEEKLELQVHNMGNPIAESDFETIFEPFKRTQRATDSAIKGWGLGLSLVKSIATSHKGHLNVKSSVKDGTIFSITLPIDS